MIRKIIYLNILINTFFVTVVNGRDEMPIATPGQCFTKSFFPPKVKKTIRKVSTKRVSISKSTVKYKVIPAKYKWINKRIKISDIKEKIVVSPAKYKIINKRILVKKAEKVWKKYSNRADNSCIQSAKSFGLNIDTAPLGTCYYEHYVPNRYKDISEKILTAEPSSRIVVSPAIYKTIRKKIITNNTTTKLISVPIKYEKVKEDVTIEPARSEWRKTTCKDRGCDESEVVCLVEVPRTFKMITKKVILKPAIAKKVNIEPTYTYVSSEVLVKPATTKTIVIPAKYKIINKRKKVENERYFWTDSRDKDAYTRLKNKCDKICLVEIPAIYKNISKKIVVKPTTTKKVTVEEKYTTVRIKQIIKPAFFKTITVPAEYIEVRVEKERTKGFAKWIPIVCESTMNSTLVKKIQIALKYQGYYSGEIDGEWGFEEKDAIRAYQKAKGLSVTRLSIETMKSLGIY